MKIFQFKATRIHRVFLSSIFLFVMTTACSDNKSYQLQLQSNQTPELDFSLIEGKALNEFYRDGKVAAHTVLTGGDTPRVIVGFPAGNSGVGLWFYPLTKDVKWSPALNKRATTDQDETGNTLYGINWHTTVSANSLTIEGAVLSNIRVLRDYAEQRTLPDDIVNKINLSDNSITWSRSRLDGKSGYKLVVTVENGSVAKQDDKFILQANNGKELTLTFAALTGDQPLTPLTVEELFNEQVGDDELSKRLLAFLSYKEKLLAGSWRFLTYFGRDTLMSTSLLMPVLQRPVVEAALASVLDSLAENGEVAHEEDIGEFAVLRSIANKEQPNAAPHYDYKMVDDNFMLACVMAQYLDTYKQHQSEIAAFLARKAPNGKSYAEQVILNLSYVYQQATPFYKNAIYQNLIALKPDMPVGEWRDSYEGLGFGRYAYNVNAVFVPAALNSVDVILKNKAFESLAATEAFAQLTEMARVWEKKAPDFFEFKLSEDISEKKLTDYATDLKIPLPSANDQKATDFYAVALDKKGEIVPVLNSDVGFALMYQHPDDTILTRMLNSVFQDFPRGLITPVGMLVANPAYADREIQAIFTRDYYHGTVVWSWQQALLLSGLNKQLQRKDLQAATQTLLTDARLQLVAIIKQSRSMKNSELWTWNYKDSYTVRHFGQDAGHKAESNAAQLWSTVYLAMPEIN